MREAAIFADGLPLRITADDVQRWHLAQFPDIADLEHREKVELAIDEVYTLFYGCETLFNLQPPQIYYEKTRQMFRWLACWYIANQYPYLVAGQPVMGAIPLKSKKIGGVAITYADPAGSAKGAVDSLGMLSSNSWGIMARDAIRSSGKKLHIGGGLSAGLRSWT